MSWHLWRIIRTAVDHMPWILSAFALATLAVTLHWALGRHRVRREWGISIAASVAATALVAALLAPWQTLRLPAGRSAESGAAVTEEAAQAEPARNSQLPAIKPPSRDSLAAHSGPRNGITSSTRAASPLSPRDSSLIHHSAQVPDRRDAWGPVKHVSAGYYHVCAVTVGGAAYCWGLNQSGQLGRGTMDDASNVPVRVAGSLRFQSVSAGAPTCGVTTEGAAYCWGSDWAPDSSDASSSSMPALLVRGLKFATVTAGNGYACGVTTSGDAFCWGSNRNGELGDGTKERKRMPVAVAGGLKWRVVSAGSWQTCGVTASGALYCWGKAWSGYARDSARAQSSVPVAGLLGLTFKQVSVGQGFACALTTDGRAYCWGDTNKHGQLGSGTTGGNTPMGGAVAGALNFMSLSTGSSHACGVTVDGTAYCWGYNYNGQLGNGTTKPSSVPVPVTGSLRFSAVTASLAHSCGLTTTGATYCWGFNDEGQSGTGSEVGSQIPVLVRAP